jgi:hypothetical protein
LQDFDLDLDRPFGGLDGVGRIAHRQFGTGQSPRLLLRVDRVGAGRFDRVHEP